MPHNLTTIDGVTEMFYYGDRPWHGLGAKVDHAATAAEAIAAANLDWDVLIQDVYTRSPEREMLLVPDRRAIVRSDTQEVFAIMKDRYSPVQNRDAFSFFDKVVGEGQAIYHTAGSLDGGRKVWILAKLSGELVAGREDLIEKFILLSNSHDGTKAFTMMITPIRVVCQNTLTWAERKGSNQFYARHTPSIEHRVVDAREILGLTDVYFKWFMDGVNRLVEKEFTQKQMQEMLKELFKLDEHQISEERLHANKEYPFLKIQELFEVGPGADFREAQGTAWGAWNAVTAFVDHFKPVGIGIKTAGAVTPSILENRMESSLFGTGADLKLRSWEYLLKN